MVSVVGRMAARRGKGRRQMGIVMWKECDTLQPHLWLKISISQRDLLFPEKSFYLNTCNGYLLHVQF